MVNQTPGQPDPTLGQSYIPGPEKAALGVPTVSPSVFSFEKLYDMTATFIRDNSNKNMGGIWLPDWKIFGGEAWRTGTGVIADYLVDGFWKDYSSRNRIPSATNFKTTEEYKNALPEDFKKFLEGQNAHPFINANTPEEAEYNIKNVVGSIYASESANNDPLTFGYWGVGTVKFVADALLDPSNWAAFGTKAAATGISKAAIGMMIKNEAKWGTLRAAYAWQRALEKQLALKTLPKQIVAASTLNAIQAATTADSGVRAQQYVFGAPQEGDPYATLYGAGIGAGFGAGLPITIAGVQMAFGRVMKNPNAEKLADNITIKQLNKASPDGIPKVEGKVELDSDKLKLSNITTAVEIANEIGFQVKRLTKTPYFQIERWGNSKWWDDVKLSGWTPDMFLEWVSRTVPNKDGISDMLDQIQILHIQKLRQSSDASFNKEIAQAWKSMGRKNLKVANALIELPDAEIKYEKNLAWFVNETYNALKSGDVSNIPLANELNDLINQREVAWTSGKAVSKLDAAIAAKAAELDKVFKQQAMDVGVLISARASAMDITADEFVAKFIKDWESNTAADSSIKGSEVLFQGNNLDKLLSGAKLKSIEVLRTKMRQPMSIGEIEKLLFGNGVKKDELKYSGFESLRRLAQADPNRKFTAQEVETAILAELFELKENYRTTASPTDKPMFERYTFDREFGSGIIDTNYQEIIFTTPDITDVNGSPLIVTGEHFDFYQNTPFMHVRVSDFVDESGKKFLRIEELQSDILQRARKLEKAEKQVRDNPPISPDQLVQRINDFITDESLSSNSKSTIFLSPTNSPNFYRIDLEFIPSKRLEDKLVSAALELQSIAESGRYSNSEIYSQFMEGTIRPDLREQFSIDYFVSVNEAEAKLVRSIVNLTNANQPFQNTPEKAFEMLRDISLGGIDGKTYRLRYKYEDLLGNFNAGGWRPATSETLDYIAKGLLSSSEVHNDILKNPEPFIQQVAASVKHDWGISKLSDLSNTDINDELASRMYPDVAPHEFTRPYINKYIETFKSKIQDPILQAGIDGEEIGVTSRSFEINGEVVRRFFDPNRINTKPENDALFLKALMRMMAEYEKSDDPTVKSDLAHAFVELFTLGFNPSYHNDLYYAPAIAFLRRIGNTLDRQDYMLSSGYELSELTSMSFGLDVNNQPLPYRDLFKREFNRLNINEFIDNPLRQFEYDIQAGLKPDLPFVDSYYDLIIKRLVHKAATEGYDGVQISNGNIVARRWSAYDEIAGTPITGPTGDGLKRYPGYQMFYDKKYVSSLEKAVKESGGKVTTVPGAAPKQDFKTGITYVKDATGNLNFYQVEFDPTIREKLISSGYYMFQQDQMNRVKAFVKFLDKEDGKAIIGTFTQKTDVSSIVHEVAHIFEKHLSEEERLAARQALGIDTDRTWTTAERERFARSFEGWLRTGKTKNKQLVPVFNRFKDWMTSIYKSLKNSEIEVNPELSDVFEQMLDPGFKPGGWKVYIATNGANKEAIKRWASTNDIKVTEGLDLDTGTGYTLRLDFGWDNPEGLIQDLYRTHWKDMEATSHNTKFNERIWNHYGKRLLVTVDASKLSDDFDENNFIDGVNRLKNEFGEGSREKSLAKLAELTGTPYIFSSPIADQPLFMFSDTSVSDLRPVTGKPFKMTVVSTAKMTEKTRSKFPKTFKSQPVNPDIAKDIKNVSVMNLSKKIATKTLIEYANSGVDALFDEATGDVWYIKHLANQERPVPKTLREIEMPEEVGQGLVPLPIDPNSSMKKVDGKIRVGVQGDINRGLLLLFQYGQGRKDFAQQAAVLESLRRMTGIDDDVELIYRAVLLNDYLKMWVKRAQKVLRANEKDKNLKIDYRKGRPVVDILIEPDAWTKVLSIQGLNPRIEKAMKTGKIPDAIRLSYKATAIQTPVEAAVRRLNQARLQREQLEKQGTVGLASSREDIQASQKEVSEARRQLTEAISKYGDRDIPERAEITKSIESGVIEKRLGEIVSESEAVQIVKESIAASSKNWLVREGWGRVSKALRKLGTIFSTGHMETIGSQVPIVAHFAKFINSITLYNDAFEHSAGYKGIGLMQMKGNADAESGAIIGRIWETMDKYNLAPNSEDEITLMQHVVARIVGINRTIDPKFEAAVKEVTAIVDNYFKVNGDRGLASGFFEALEDNYAGSFHIARNMERVGDLTAAFRSVLARIFTTDDGSPLHNRTLRTNTGVFTADGTLDARYNVVPTTVADLLPEHKTEYLDALNDMSLDSNNIPKRGLYADAFFMTKNKLGHVEAKPLRGLERGMRYTDPTLQRRIYVEAFFESELMPFIDWSINGIIGNYGERVAYKIREREAVNQLVFDITGQRRRDIDLDTLFNATESVLLTDSTISQEARDAIKGSFEYLRSKVSAIRGQVGRDITREMGVIGETADILIDLGRVPVSASSGIAGVFTEAIPLIASVAHQTKNVSTVIRTILKMFRGSSREELKGMLAGMHSLRTHMPGEIASMRSINTLNRSWWDKNFVNPIRDIGTASSVGNRIRAVTLALHRMASGVGFEEGIQASVSNAAVFADMFRFVSSIPNLERLITAIEKHGGPVDEVQFNKFVEEAGFNDPLFAAQLNQNGFVNREVLNEILDMNRHSKGQLLDQNGSFMDYDLMVSAMLANPSIYRQKVIDMIQGLKQSLLDQRVTRPTVTEMRAPSGGVGPFDRLYNVFLSYGRSWFSNTMLNNLANSKLNYALFMISMYFVGELLYNEFRSVVYQGKSMDELLQEWEENPGERLASAMARSNFGGNMTDLAHGAFDLFGNTGRAPGGLYPVTNAWRVSQAAVDSVKAILSSEKEVDLKKAALVERSIPGINSWWVRALLRSTGYKSFSEWILSQE